MHSRLTSRSLLASLLLSFGAAYCAPGQTITNIQFLKQDLNMDFKPDNTNAQYEVRGRITSPDLVYFANNTAFTEMYIQDTNDNFGIQVLFNDPGGFDPSAFTVGKEAQVKFAFVRQTNGVTNVRPFFDLGSVHFTITDNNVIPVTPVSINISNLLANAERWEGVLVSVANVTKSTGWPAYGASSTLTMNDGTGTLNLRIDQHTNVSGQYAPVTNFNLTGIFTQFTTTNALNAGYQIIPRFYSDFDQGLPPSPPALQFIPASPLGVIAGDPVSFNLLGLDANESDTLTFGSVNPPAGSALVTVSDRLATFTFNPAAAGSTSFIDFTVSDGSTTVTQTMEIVVLKNKWTFDTGLQGWTTFSRSSNRDWTNRNSRMEMNGFGATTDGSDDWLISPLLDLTTNAIPRLDYLGEVAFAGFPSNLILNVSTDYSGSGDPLASATWDEIAIPEPPLNTPTLILSDLGAYAGAPALYLAFRYQSSAPGAVQHSWRIDDISLRDVASTPPQFNPPIEDQTVTVGGALTINVVVIEANGDAVTLTAANAPSGSVFTPTNGTGGATGALSWTPLVTDTGVYSMAFIASDADGSTTNAFDITVFPPISGSLPWINEIHYDNAGTDVGEFIEIAGPSGLDLGAYSIVLYNGSGGAPYNTTTLTGVIDDEGDCIGALSFSYPANGIQNGPPDGIALVQDGATVIEFISYEGTFTASGGPADGLTSIDIGVEETSSTPIGQSVHLVGSGNSRANFTWSGPTNASPGSLNLDQTIVDGCGTGPVDSDGDGVSDADEAIAGTNPGDSNDFFAVKGVLSPASGSVTVTLPTKTTRNYVIQYKDDLSSTNEWQNLDPAAVGSGGNDGFTDSGATNQFRFYRGDVRIP